MSFPIDTNGSEKRGGGELYDPSQISKYKRTYVALYHDSVENNDLPYIPIRAVKIQDEFETNKSGFALSEVVLQSPDNPLPLSVDYFTNETQAEQRNFKQLSDISSKKTCTK